MSNRRISGPAARPSGARVLRTVAAGGALACVFAFAPGLASPAVAQEGGELSPVEKTEGFIQHLVKVTGLEPTKYRSLVLQYEIRRALNELLAMEHETHAAEHQGHCCDPSGFQVDDADFIEAALREVFPSYGQLAKARDALGEATDRAAAGAALLRQARGLTSDADPYVAAYAALAAAELEFDGAASAPDGEAAALARVMERCEKLLLRERRFLIPDHRASELIARCYQRLEKPLFEFAQLLIVLTDFPHLPKADAERIEGRAKELAKTHGQPLGTVGSWMRGVEGLLEEEVTAEDPTQREERQVLAALDKLIELQEARERRACPNCGGGNCQGQCRGGNPKGNRSSSPAQVSRLAEAEGRVLLRGVSRGDPRAVWGELGERQGAQALQGFSGKLPPRYEQLLEQYFEDLSRTEEP